MTLNNKYEILKMCCSLFIIEWGREGGFYGGMDEGMGRREREINNSMSVSSVEISKIMIKLKCGSLSY